MNITISLASECDLMPGINMTFRIIMQYILNFAERLSARHIILQHALGQRMYVCIILFVRHAHLRMRARMAGT